MIYQNDNAYFIMLMMAFAYMGLMVFSVSRWIQSIETKPKEKGVEKILFVIGYILQLVGLTGVTYFLFS